MSTGTFEQSQRSPSDMALFLTESLHTLTALFTALRRVLLSFLFWAKKDVSLHSGPFLSHLITSGFGVIGRQALREVTSQNELLKYLISRAVNPAAWGLLYRALSTLLGVAMDHRSPAECKTAGFGRYFQKQVPQGRRIRSEESCHACPYSGTFPLFHSEERATLYTRRVKSFHKD